jgi:hypothetical protein
MVVKAQEIETSKSSSTVLDVFCGSNSSSLSSIWWDPKELVVVIRVKAEHSSEAPSSFARDLN